MGGLPGLPEVVSRLHPRVPGAQRRRADLRPGAPLGSHRPGPLGRRLHRRRSDHCRCPHHQWQLPPRPTPVRPDHPHPGQHHHDQPRSRRNRPRSAHHGHRIAANQRQNNPAIYSSKSQLRRRPLGRHFSSIDDSVAHVFGPRVRTGRRVASRSVVGRVSYYDSAVWTSSGGRFVTEMSSSTRFMPCARCRADKAEQSYDVEELRRRRGGRPPMGSAASSVESVRLDPELKRDLLLRAAEDHISVSEVIRRAIGQYLRAA